MLNREYASSTSSKMTRTERKVDEQVSLRTSILSVLLFKLRLSFYIRRVGVGVSLGVGVGWSYSSAAINITLSSSISTCGF